MLEVLFVYGLIQTLIVASRAIDLVQREKQLLGWSYTVPLTCFAMIPALTIWLTHRNWAEQVLYLRPASLTDSPTRWVNR